jgi:hypothetical protein
MNVVAILMIENGDFHESAGKLLLLHADSWVLAIEMF